MPLAYLSVNQRFLVAAGLSTLSVAIALVTQYGFDMQPCPWCVLQRVIFMLIALVCLFAVAIPSRPARFVLGASVVLLGLGGIGAALYQHFVASRLDSCALTLADRILNAFNLEALWPAVLQVRASCADGAVNLFGLPYEFWSLGVYTVVVVVTAGAIARLRRLD